MSLYLNINQQQAGPYEISNVNQMLVNSEISLETLGWMEGMANWEPLSSPTFTGVGIKGQTATHSSSTIQNPKAQNSVRGNGTFSIGLAIGEAFTFFKANALGSIAWLVITSALSSTGIGFLLLPLLGVNYFGCAKRFQETGQKMEIGDLFDFSKAVEKIFGPIILGFIIGIGLICLIIPGFIFSMWWTFSPCVLADRPDLSFIDSMKESRRVAKGNWIKLIVLFIAIGFLQIAGLLCFGVGLLVTIPVGHIALFYAYNQCKN